MQVNQEGLAVVIDFQTAVENDEESLSRYVNRRGENPTENAPWGTFSLWLMVKNDGTSNTHEHEERPKVLKKTRAEGFDILNHHNFYVNTTTLAYFSYTPTPMQVVEQKGGLGTTATGGKMSVDLDNFPCA